MGKLYLYACMPLCLVRFENQKKERGDDFFLENHAECVERPLRWWQLGAYRAKHLRKLRGGVAELTCTHGNPGCISVFDVALSAMQVDKLQINKAVPSSDHKPYWHTQIQKRVPMRIPG